jgi:hypothetical protein
MPALERTFKKGFLKIKGYKEKVEDCLAIIIILCYITYIFYNYSFMSFAQTVGFNKRIIIKRVDARVVNGGGL